MTVGELIESLKKYPKDSKINIWIPYFEGVHIVGINKVKSEHDDVFVESEYIEGAMF